MTIQTLPPLRVLRARRCGLLLTCVSSAALVLAVAGCSGDNTATGPDSDGGEGGSTFDGSTADDSSVTGDAATLDGTAPGDAADASKGPGPDDGAVEGDTGHPGTADSGPTGTDAGPDSGPSPHDAGGSDGDASAAPDGATVGQGLVTTVGSGVVATRVTINQGTAIGQGALNGSTPATLSDLALDSNNGETVQSAVNPFARTGNVPDTAAGFCTYTDAGAPTRITHVTGAKFQGAGDAGLGTDPQAPMAPFYFPLTYTTTLTPSDNAFGGQPPIIGLFDYRPKDIDEALVVAESDDNGVHWYFMQTVLELNPDYSNQISGGYASGSTNTGCPGTVTSTNASFVSTGGTIGDDGWGHASIIQLPGASNAQTQQFLYMLDRNGQGTSPPIDSAGLRVINLTSASNKFPVWNTNNTNAGANDIKSISTALTNTTGTANPVVVKSTTGLLDPDGIMAVFPDTKGTAAAGSAVTVLYVQKILSGDDTGSTALPAAQQCAKAPFSGKTNHDISNVRLATTTDGVTFTDLGIVSGLNDPTTVDYNGTRWISPRGTLLDVNGDGSLWGLYFAGGNCLDGDSDAFHYIGYAESTDKLHWTVYNDINHPIASINTITAANQAGGAMVTIPANPPVFATEYWFAERLYAPSATRIDATHLGLTFAGYGVQTPNKDLLDYRQIGNVVLTVSKALPAGVPNNINAH